MTEIDLVVESADREHKLILFSGTIATKFGLAFGESFEIEMEDPVLERTIHHGYRIRVLPQHL